MQALLNYSFSHSLDNASNDVVAGVSNTVISAANDYASSDFDARHSFSGAVTWQIPSTKHDPILSAITRDWSLATIVVARSGFPFNAQVFLGAGVLRKNSPGPIWYPDNRSGSQPSGSRREDLEPQRLRWCRQRFVREQKAGTTSMVSA